ncbi:MAG: hypothetical protein Q8S24_05905 [Eubacteriales bacterium]|nr:hypothetical protein [Eubacteriales bacterium]
MTMVITLLNIKFKVRVKNIGLIAEHKRDGRHSNRFNNLNTIERDLERVKEFYSYGSNIK